MSIVQHKADILVRPARRNPVHRAGALLLLAVPVLAILLAGCGADRPIKYFQLTYPTPAPASQTPMNVSLWCALSIR